MSLTGQALREALGETPIQWSPEEETRLEKTRDKIAEMKARAARVRLSIPIGVSTMRRLTKLAREKRVTPSRMAEIILEKVVR